MKTQHTSIISILCLLCSTAFAQDFEESYKAVASDRAEGDYFGQPVCISGNYAIIGAAFEDEDTAGTNTIDDAGSAYIFKRDIYGNWHEIQKIVASDRGAGDRFGCSLGISGDYAIVGAWLEDEDTSGNNSLADAGSVYIFKRDGYDNWNEVQKIVASDRAADDHFGRSVSIADSLIIAGATREDEDKMGSNTLSNAGSAYIFKRDETGKWNEIQKIVASDRGVDDHFGLSVDISEHYIVVSARDDDEDAQGEDSLDGAGSAYIFERNGNNNWIEVQKIVAPVRNAGDLFANSVCISDNYIAIGAPTEDEDASEGNTLANSGSVYIFIRETNGNWIDVQKIVVSDREGEEYFGNEVSISGNRMIVGAHYEDNNALGEDSLEYARSAYIFTRNNNDEWVESQKIVASDRDVFDFFGYSVSISGDYAIAGARTECEDAIGQNTLEYAGSAYIFESCIHGSTIDPENILENGDFENCILSPWYIYVADDLGGTATAVLINGECQVSEITLTSDPQAWDVQLNQSFTTEQLERLETGATYELSFDAYAETDDRQCRVVFEQDEDPWNNLLAETFIIHTEPVSYSYEFEMSTVYSVMKLSFQPGMESASFTIDNVRLVNISGNALPGINGESAVKIMPNPARDFIRVTAANGSRMRLYNSLGSMVMESILQSGYTELDVSNMLRGVYLVETNHGGQITREKVAIQ